MVVVFISLLLALLTLAGVLYPFFWQRSVPEGFSKKRAFSHEASRMGEDVEDQIRRFRHQKEKVCLQCRSVNRTDARFCSKCGIRFTGEK